MMAACRIAPAGGASGDGEGAVAVRGIAEWLCLAASPTFAAMAWIAADGASPMAVCTAGPVMLPIGGMTAMYLLMSLFHLSPWLKLAAGRLWAHAAPTTKGD